MIVAIIPAKEDSTRLPNKNMIEINGKPLVGYAIDYAKKSSKIDKIFVSTDSDEIAKYAKKRKVEIIRRGSELGGEVPLIDIYRHAWKKINNKKITYIVGIPPDNPDRKINIDEAIKYMMKKKIDYLFTVDRNGHRNGSLWILNENALRAEPSIYAASLPDDAVNIHTHRDFLIAKRNVLGIGKTISIGKRKIGEGHPAFIVAEGACNHMCRVDFAKKMIDLAVKAGADAIKFQTYKAERLVRKSAKAYWVGKQISQVEYYKKLDKFGIREYEELFQYAKKRGIVAFSTPFDVDSATMLNSLGVPLFKIASCDLPDKRLLRHIASFGKPIILSTGASTPEEIDEAVFTIYEAGNFQLILLACTLSYPTRDEDANLLRIKSLQERYPGIIVGLSDHTEPDKNMVIPSLGVALGAKVIEKHYTLDRSMTGSGHSFSVNPRDLKNMVENIRLTEKVMGSSNLNVLRAEEAARLGARRSIVANQFIKKGETITSDMIGLKRPADGLPGSMIDKIIGKRTCQNIQKDVRIIFKMLKK